MEAKFRKLIKPAAKAANSQLNVCLQTSGGFLLGVFLGSFVLNAFAQSIIVPGVMSVASISGIFVMVVSDLLVSFFFLIVLPSRILDVRRNKPVRPVWNLLKHYFRDLTAEMLRVASGMLFGLLMAVVPGILRALHWYLVPFVVVSDPNYDKGDVDALEESAKLSKGILWGLAIAWLVFFLIDTGLYLADQAWWNNLKADSPLAWGGSIVINLCSTAFTIYSTLFFFAIYELRQSAQGET